MTKRQFDRYMADWNNNGDLIWDFWYTMMEEIEHLPEKYEYFDKGADDGIMCYYMDELIRFYVSLRKNRREKWIKDFDDYLASTENPMLEIVNKPLDGEKND